MKPIPYTPFFYEIRVVSLITHQTISNDFAYTGGGLADMCKQFRKEYKEEMDGDLYTLVTCTVPSVERERSFVWEARDASN